VFTLTNAIKMRLTILEEPKVIVVSQMFFSVFFFRFFFSFFFSSNLHAIVKASIDLKSYIVSTSFLEAEILQIL